MHTVRLELNNRTDRGSVHANLIIDGQDTGVLYLSSDELDIMTRLLDSGASNIPGIEFDTRDESPVKDEEFDYDVFE